MDCSACVAWLVSNANVNMPVCHSCSWVTKCSLLVVISEPVLRLSDLGYSWSGAVPEPRCSVLPWCRLLYTGLWCDVIQLVPFTGQLERWVPHPGKSSWPGPLPICRHWQQNWSRLSRGQL